VAGIEGHSAPPQTYFCYRVPVAVVDKEVVKLDQRGSSRPGAFGSVQSRIVCAKTNGGPLIEVNAFPYNYNNSFKMNDF
jgi:hypothetical protein